MGKARHRTIAGHPSKGAAVQGQTTIQVVDSLLDCMVDGSEYGSIVDKIPRPDQNLIEVLRSAIAEIEALRGRPCIVYVGNVVKPGEGASVELLDDLPFAEMVNSVPAEHKKVDVFLATLGGSGQQVVRFVNALRARFEEIDFLIPSVAMSAGTLFCLSGDRIWMNPQAALGPVDPQVPTKDGRFVPAQALLLLVQQLQIDGQRALSKGQPVPWTAVRIVDTIDKKELGDAVTASNYASEMASKFLDAYKFKHWKKRQSSGLDVTPEYRLQRANEVGAALVSHERWKSHGHAISREVLWEEIKLKIEHPDAALERALRRMWALCYWLFDKTAVQKVMVSKNFGFFRHINPPGAGK